MGEIQPEGMRPAAAGHPHAFLAWMRRRSRALTEAIVTDVPPALAACELVCRRTRCDEIHWLTCALRIEAEERAAPPRDQAV